MGGFKGFDTFPIFNMAGMIVPNAEHFFSAAGAVLEIMEVGVNGRDGLGTQGPRDLSTTMGP